MIFEVLIAKKCVVPVKTFNLTTISFLNLFSQKIGQLGRSHAVDAATRSRDTVG